MSQETSFICLGPTSRLDQVPLGPGPDQPIPSHLAPGICHFCPASLGRAQFWENDPHTGKPGPVGNPPAPEKCGVFLGSSQESSSWKERRRGKNSSFLLLNLRLGLTGMRDGQEKEQLKAGTQLQAGLRLVCGKLSGAGGITDSPGLLHSCISRSLAVGSAKRQEVTLGAGSFH